MITLIALFLPAVLSVWIWESANKTVLTKRNWLYSFVLYTVLINFVCFAVKKWVLHTGDAVINSIAADMTPSVACNYLIMALPLAVIFPLVPVVLRWIRTHVRFRIVSVNKTVETANEK